MCNRTQHLEFIKFKIMKLLKKSFLGIAFLLAIGTSSFASSDTTTNTVNFEDSMSNYQFCDIMYPDNFSYFDACMGFGFEF